MLFFGTYYISKNPDSSNIRQIYNIKYYISIYLKNITVFTVHVHLKKIEYGGKVNFFLVTFQKVKLSYILD